VLVMIGRPRTSAENNGTHVVTRMTEFGDRSNTDLVSLYFTNTDTYYDLRITRKPS